MTNKSNETTNKNPQNSEVTMSEENEKAIEKTDATLGALAPLTENNDVFAATYKEQLARVSVEIPTKMELQKIMDELPEEYEALFEIVRKTMGSKRGVYSQESSPLFPELRVYQGTGNDPNRPEEMVPGQYYLTSKETVGKTFEGTILAIWSGRTMWGDANAGESTKMPICQSMDRKRGSAYGDCSVCPHRPWKDGKLQRCGNDVVAFMLSADLKDIVLVRFMKTSEPAGKQLLKFVRRSMEPWSRWYKLSTAVKVNPNDSTKRWYLMNVEPSEGDDSLVPEEIYPFCEAMCTSLEATYILPNMASIYRQGAEEEEDDDTGAEGGGSAGMMSAEDAEKKDEDFGDFDDAPNV